MLLSLLAVAGFCIRKHSRISVFTSSLLWNGRPLHSCFSRPKEWSVLRNKTHSRGRTSDTRPFAFVSVGTSGPWLDRFLWRWRHYSPSNSWVLFAHRHSVTWETRFESSIARGWFWTWHWNDCITIVWTCVLWVTSSCQSKQLVVTAEATMGRRRI
jgi:hypothetical protein